MVSRALLHGFANTGASRLENLSVRDCRQNHSIRLNCEFYSKITVWKRVRRNARIS